MLVWPFTVAAFGCEAEHTLEPTVAARPGIVQGSGEGELIDEGPACDELRDALETARSDNDCDDVEIPSCPELIRPGGSLACVRFTEESIAECVEVASEYDSCDDFASVSASCVVVAVVDETSEGCVPPSAPDAGSDAGAGPDGGPGDDTPPEDREDAGAGDAADSGSDTPAPTDSGLDDDSMDDSSVPPIETDDAGTEPEPEPDSGMVDEEPDSGSFVPVVEAGISDAG